MKKYTNESFIEKAKQVHGDKYDYSKVNYVNASTKVTIICPKHGEFTITPGNFLYGQGCRFCGIEKRQNDRKMSLDEFVTRAKQVHGDKYDYSKVEYINCDTNVCIICPEHGEFWQTPYKHIHEKNGCPKCAGNVNYSTEEYIEKASKKHNNKYDYSKTNYINAYTKICIICSEHGEFWQTPSSHLTGAGCPKCKGKNKTTEDFINEAIEIHGNKYDFSLVEYNGAFNPIRVICKKHGEFITTPHSILDGSGCMLCGHDASKEKQKLSKEQFIERAKKVHGDKYDYSKVEYINAKTPVCITCLKHGDFYITPNRHTSIGKTGCPKCTESQLETSIRVFCETNNINFIQQKSFQWLGLQRLDFYLPDYNIAIECQGIYHFEPHYTSTADNAEKNLLNQIKRDELKKLLLSENEVKVFYYVPENLIKYTSISKIYTKENLFSEINDLFKILDLQ